MTISRTVAIRTLGCKLNQYESMGMQELLEKYGFEIVNPNEFADFYIVNSCTVTGKTDRRSRNAVRRVLKINPSAKIVVTGCGAQRDAHEFNKIPGVIAVIGNREKNQVVQYLRQEVETENVIVDVSDISTAPFEKLTISSFRNYTRAFLKIQEGCNRACSYCVIPEVRGRSRSQQTDQILTEIKDLVDRNFREIVFTGIDLGTYGHDMDPKTSLKELLDQVIKIEGLARVRLSSIEPMEFNPDLIERITNTDKICRHFHIPIQSGCNSILKRMNRTYSTGECADIIQKIRTRSPDACIGSDVITAFPGETEDEFKATYDYISDLPINYLHVFTYSIRENTPAADFPDKVDPNTARDRCHALRNLGHSKALELRHRMIGKSLPVIILGSSDKETGLPRSLSDNYIQVLIKNDCPPKGTIGNAIIDDLDGLNCIGRFEA